MKTLKDFSQELFTNLANKPTVKNVYHSMSLILKSGSCCMYSSAADINIYEKIERTLSRANKMSTIEPKLINKALINKAVEKFNDEPELYLIHDPSDIRKPYSKKAENIGKVRSLDSKIINGYSTHNIIAITPNGKKLSLVSNTTYSNKDDNFLSQEHIKMIMDGIKFNGDNQATNLYKTGNYFNKKSLSKLEIERVSGEFKKQIPNIAITHILDREFDDNDYIDLICSLGDNFVIRSKKSRCDTEEKIDNKKVRLIDEDFDKSYDIKVQKICIKKKCVQDGIIRIQWSKRDKYTAVKITILDRNNNNVFDDPMLILTNKEIVDGNDVYQIYRDYLQRSKIEYVFKFLKDGLGWEDMQMQSFKAIENTISICFYVAAYLYEIGDKDAHDDYSVVLAELGDGKGKVTRHYILKGIQALMIYHKVKLIKSWDKQTSNVIETLGEDMEIDI